MIEAMLKTVARYEEFLKRVNESNENNAEYTWYRVNAEQGGCPLCRAADNYCGNCPWTKYTKGTCTTAVGTTSFMSARNAISDSNKELINHYIGARIAELREWIKLEERT